MEIAVRPASTAQQRFVIDDGSKVGEARRAAQKLATLEFNAEQAGKVAIAATELSIADSVDTRTAGGRLVLNVLTSVAQWEREAIGERTRDALRHLKSKGIRIGGEALGWKRAGATDAEGRRSRGLENDRGAVAWRGWRDCGDKKPAARNAICRTGG